MKNDTIKGTVEGLMGVTEKLYIQIGAKRFPIVSAFRDTNALVMRAHYDTDCKLTKNTLAERTNQGIWLQVRHQVGYHMVTL